MSTPRIVLVSRPSALDALTRRHGTRMQAAFHAKARGLTLDALEDEHAKLASAMESISNAIPSRWRRVRLERAELSRFVFEPNDTIVCVGPDGLVANVAKYLTSQRVIATNPLGRGPLTYHSTSSCVTALLRADAEDVDIELRPLVEASANNRIVLRALNEIYLGHRTHQSARYTLEFGSLRDAQISSGIVVSTGTGATGWALSIARAEGKTDILPAPTDRAAAFFVRELWSGNRASLASGRVAAGGILKVTSEMNESGVL